MNNRPWHRDQTRLGLKISSDRNLGTGIGWWLYRLESVGQHGEVNVPGPRPSGVQLIYTAAEFAILRRECGLSQSEAIQYLGGPAQKTFSIWENKLGAPIGGGEKRAEGLAGLRAAMDQAVQTSVALAKHKRDEDGVIGIDLYAYRAGDYVTSKPALEGLPHGAHMRLLALTAAALTAEGFNVTIDYA